MHLSRWIGVWAILASAALLLPSLAQDNKGADKKEVEKKEGDKKDPDKKDAAKGDDPKDKTDPKKKADKGEPKPPEEKVVYGDVLLGKLKQMDANSQKDFTIQLTYKLQEPNLDAQRQLVQQKQQLAQQQAQLGQQQAQLAQHQFNFKRAKSADEARQAQQQIVNIQQQMASAQQSIASTLNAIRQTQGNLVRTKELQKDVPVRAVENIKVRSLYPPVVYDDKGQLKAWTPKELAALKAGSKLPGYAAEYEILRPGQMVRVYLAKQVAPAKAKKKFDDDDDLLPSRPEVVMIVVELEAAPQR